VLFGAVVKKAKFFPASLPKTVNTIKKRAITKRALNFAAHFSFSARALRYATRFQRKWGIIKNFANLSEF
jgi:hypothetical protein